MKTPDTIEVPRKWMEKLIKNVENVANTGSSDAIYLLGFIESAKELLK